MKEHKFNSGDIIRHKLYKDKSYTISMVDEFPYFMYRCEDGTCMDVCVCDNQYIKVDEEINDYSVIELVYNLICANNDSSASSEIYSHYSYTKEDVINFIKNKLNDL